MKNIDFDDYLKEQLKDPEFKKEWEASEEEFLFVNNLIQARKKSSMTQKELSIATGIHQSEISKIETGNANPSFATICKLAKGMGMKCNITFTPLTK